jgi:coenzyme Q-binding protein COQ10
MASKTMRPFANTLLQSQNRTIHRAAPSITNYQRQQRAFFSNPFASEKQTLTASRTLQYPAKVIYDTISDVSSYSSFIPYCQSSVVTKTSKPAEDGKSYPEEAKLTIGFNNDVSEEFWSRVYCQPERVVEAVSGLTNTALSSEAISHHNARPSPDQDPTRNESVLTHLSTTWTLRPFPYKPPPPSAGQKTDGPGIETTDVNLVIEYQFANPVYGALSAAAAPKVAEKMIEAFENRVKAVAEGRV